MKTEIIKYLGGRFIPAAVNLALIILAIRFLGPAEYGKYSLLLFTVLMIVTVSFHWIQVSIVRFLGTISREINLVVSRFFFMTLLSSLISVALVLFPALFYFELSFAETGLLMVFTFINHFYMMHLAIFQAHHRPIRMAVMEGSDHLVIILVLLTGIFLFSVKSYILIFVSMSLGILVAEGVRILIRVNGLYHLEYYRSVWDNRFSRRVFEFGASMTLWLFLSHLMASADRFILYAFNGYDVAGGYSAVKDLFFKTVTFTATPVFLSYQHKILEEWNTRHKEEARQLVREALNFEIVIFIVIFIIFMVGKSYILKTILRLPEMEHWQVYIPLLLSAFLWQICMLFQKTLEMVSQQRSVLIVMGIVAAFNLIANLFLVPQYSVFASSWIMLFTAVIIFIILSLIRKYRTGMNHS